jgi:hypothetical protein
MSRFSQYSETASYQALIDAEAAADVAEGRAMTEAGKVLGKALCVCMVEAGKNPGALPLIQ